MSERVQRTVWLGNVEGEPVTGLGVGDSHSDPSVVRTPEQPDVDAVVRAAVQLAHRVGELSVHGMSLPSPRPHGIGESYWSGAAAFGLALRVSRYGRRSLGASR